MGSERRGRAVHGRLEVNPSGEEPTDRPRQKNAGLWEPYDGRLSRTVLREREGEVPSRHSPGAVVLDRVLERRHRPQPSIAWADSVSGLCCGSERTTATGQTSLGQGRSGSVPCR